MATYRVGRFEVEGFVDMSRTMLAAGLLIGLGEPLISASLRYVPRRDGHRLTREWAGAARRFLGVDLEVEGLTNVEHDSQYVVAPLHEGFADALALATLPLDLRYVVRDELFEWPHLGRALSSSRQIRVTPENRVTGYRKVLDEAKDTVRRGESLVVFPQGSILGIETSFRSGPFRIADRLGLPLLPVAITGSHLVWEHPYSDRLRFGQRVSMAVLEPVPVGQALNRMREIEQQTKTKAQSPTMAAARRFDPDRDGYWDGYSYDIDPSFPTLARKIERHRAGLSAVG